MKTLAYDCGNPVQYVCGRPPAVLFYLLDRHASLAMTKRGGESDNYELTLSLRRSTINVENVGGRLWQSSYNMSAGIRPQCFFLFTGSPRSARDDKRGGESDNYELTLSLRRSTINVENVVVRLRQSSTICLRAFARSAFLFTGSPRFARDDKGD